MQTGGFFPPDKGDQKFLCLSAEAKYFFSVSAGTAPRIKFPDQSHLNGRLSVGAPRFSRQIPSEGAKDRELIVGKYLLGCVSSE